MTCFTTCDKVCQNMILAYIDESGTNYQKINKYFKDGPYAIWSCILIDEKKYLDIERTFQTLAKRTLPSDLCTRELHAYKIWEGRKIDTQHDKKVRKYFEELSQFISKLHIQILIGIQQKNPTISNRCVRKKKEELERSRYALISLIEHQLAECNETAILVSDAEDSNEALKEMVLQRTKWRYSPTNKKIKGVKPKFQFEYNSNYILDQLHYVDSKSSLLIQFSDNICFILRKVLEHLYLLSYPDQNKNRPIADVDHVPISCSTFNFLVHCCKIKFANYNSREKDVNIGDVETDMGPYRFDKNNIIIAGRSSVNIGLLNLFTPFR